MSESPAAEGPLSEANKGREADGDERLNQLLAVHYLSFIDKSLVVGAFLVEILEPAVYLLVDEVQQNLF